MMICKLSLLLSQHSKRGEKIAFGILRLSFDDLVLFRTTIGVLIFGASETCAFHLV
jgi:hypothetical protein